MFKRTKGLGELKSLTPAEKLLLERRRKNQTQREAAARHKVSYSRYGLWECNKITEVPKVIIKEVKPHERCLLYRRRANFTQARVAGEMKICRWWLNQMERGEIDCSDLIKYWES
jgi:transcriptional regulator with XRE-family HTH domain